VRQFLYERDILSQEEVQEYKKMVGVKVVDLRIGMTTEEYVERVLEALDVDLSVFDDVSSENEKMDVVEMQKSTPSKTPIRTQRYTPTQIRTASSYTLEYTPKCLVSYDKIMNEVKYYGIDVREYRQGILDRLQHGGESGLVWDKLRQVLGNASILRDMHITLALNPSKYGMQGDSPCKNKGKQDDKGKNKTEQGSDVWNAAWRYYMQVMKEQHEGGEKKRIEFKITHVVFNERIVCLKCELKGDKVVCVNEYPHITVGVVGTAEKRESNDILRSVFDGENGSDIYWMEVEFGDMQGPMCGFTW
jgi:tRNA splicing ligase